MRAAALLALLLVTNSAAAQPAATGGAESGDEYAETIRQALGEYEAGNFAEARSLFTRAHALYPNARTLRGLGLVEFELRNYLAAAENLSLALESQVRPLAGELRHTTEAALARARNFIAELTLDIEPADARVLIDETPLERWRGRPVLIGVGDHRLRVRAPGYEPEQRLVSIKGGERLELRIELGVLSAQGAPQTSAADAAEAPARDSGDGAWPWVVVGSSAALAIGGGVLFALARDDITSVEDAERGATWSSVSDAHDSAPIKSGVGLTMMGVGAAGVAGGLLWAFVWDRAEQPVALTVQPRGVQVAGRF